MTIVLVVQLVLTVLLFTRVVEASNDIITSNDGFIPIEVIVGETSILTWPEGVLTSMNPPTMVEHNLPIGEEVVAIKKVKSSPGLPGNFYQLSLYERAKILNGRWGGQCVNLVKTMIGWKGTYGDAVRLQPNKDKAEVGDTILLGRIHAGLIVQIYMKLVNDNPQRIYIIVDSNLKNDERVRMYEVPEGDDSIRGFLRK